MSLDVRWPATGLVVVALALLACKKSSVEGTYSLDKTDTKQQMEQEIQSMPEGEREMAQLGVALIDMLEMTIELKEGGVAVVQTKLPNLEGGQPEIETEQGTWSHKDSTVTIVSGGDTTTCASSDSKLRCKDKKGKSIVFVKKT